MKKLTGLLLLACSTLYGQTTTGTAQRIGNIWYYDFYTQPAPRFQVYQPLQVPLVNTFGPTQQAIYGLAQSLQWKRDYERSAEGGALYSDCSRKRGHKM